MLQNTIPAQTYTYNYSDKEMKKVVRFSELSRLHLVDNLSLYKHEIWFTADELRSIKTNAGGLLKYLAVNENARDKIDMSHAFGLERFWHHDEFLHRRHKLISTVLTEHRRQHISGVANDKVEIERLARISEKHSTWAKRHARASAYALYLNNQENDGESDSYIRLLL